MGGDGSRFRAAQGIAEDRPLLLYVGRVAHEKNIDFLLRVVDELLRDCPDILLVIAGEGPAERSLRQQAAQPRSSCVYCRSNAGRQMAR